MRMIRRRNVVAAVAAGAAVAVLASACGSGGDDGAPTAGTTTADPQSAPPPTARGDRVVGTAVYARDLTATATALSSFAGALRTVDTPAELRQLIPGLTSDLDRLDSAIGRMARYTVDNARAEEQRERLVRTGPRLGDLLRRFIAAAEEGDGAGIQALVPQIRDAIGDFAASPGAP